MPTFCAAEKLGTGSAAFAGGAAFSAVGGLGGALRPQPKVRDTMASSVRIRKGALPLQEAIPVQRSLSAQCMDV
jgi:hypothetical protein